MLKLLAALALLAGCAGAPFDSEPTATAPLGELGGGSATASSATASASTATTAVASSAEASSAIASSSSDAASSSGTGSGDAAASSSTIASTSSSAGVGGSGGGSGGSGGSGGEPPTAGRVLCDVAGHVYLACDGEQRGDLLIVWGTAAQFADGSAPYCTGVTVGYCPVGTMCEASGTNKSGVWTYYGQGVCE